MLKSQTRIRDSTAAIIAAGTREPICKRIKSKQIGSREDSTGAGRFLLEYFLDIECSVHRQNVPRLCSNLLYDSSAAYPSA